MYQIQKILNYTNSLSWAHRTPKSITTTFSKNFINPNGSSSKTKVYTSYGLIPTLHNFVKRIDSIKYLVNKTLNTTGSGTINKMLITLLRSDILTFSKILRCAIMHKPTFLLSSYQWNLAKWIISLWMMVFRSSDLHTAPSIPCKLFMGHSYPTKIWLDSTCMESRRSGSIRTTLKIRQIQP